MGQYQTFIVRFWTDGSDEVARGHIQHVATGRGLYFRDIARMLHFLDQHVSATIRPTRVDETAAVRDAPPTPPMDGEDGYER